MIELIPSHRLAVKQREVTACTYHRFFRWKSDEWTPDGMGGNIFLKSLFEISTESLEILQIFLI